MHIELISAATLAGRAAEFVELLRDAVFHGASLGFTLPLPEAEVAAYWRKVGAELADGNKLLLAALDENDALIGGAQLARIRANTVAGYAPGLDRR